MFLVQNYSYENFKMFYDLGSPVMAAYISLEFWCFVLSIHPNK